MKRILRLFIVAIISNSLIFLPLVNTYAAEGLALPSGDLIAPEIISPPVTKQIPPGDTTIHATVTDNVGVKNVTIFYRNIGAIDFERTEMMRELGVDDEYSVTLPEIMVPGIEYYIQATDQAGNTILHGHTFSPLTLTVSLDALPQEGQDAIAAAPQEGAAEKPDKGISKWVWIGLGVLAVGAIAASGGDSGGTPEPTTGTINITGPTP